MLRFLARFWIVKSDCAAINAIAETLKFESEDWDFYPWGHSTLEEWKYKKGLIVIRITENQIRYFDSYSKNGTIDIKWSELGLLLDAAKTAKRNKHLLVKNSSQLDDGRKRMEILDLVKMHAKHLTVSKPRQLLPANKKVML